MSLVPDLDPYFGLSGLSVMKWVLVQHPETHVCSPGLYSSKEKHTVSVHVPLMTGTAVSHNFGIPASEGNPTSCVQADGSSNMSSVLSD